MKKNSMEADTIKLAITTHLKSIYPQFNFVVLVYRTGNEVVAEVQYTDFLPEKIIRKDLENLHTFANVIDVTRKMSKKAILHILSELYKTSATSSQISVTKEDQTTHYCNLQSYVIEKFITTNFEKNTSK